MHSRPLLGSYNTPKGVAQIMNEVTATADAIIALTADIVSAHLSNNSVAVGDLPALIQNVHDALTGLGRDAPAAEPKREPAVPVRASVKPDYIVCLEDGKRLKMLRRHLLTNYQMTPEQYRAKWNLPPDYPMVAPNYTEQRRTLAKKIGLGTRGRSR
jgi:predicted transcriptional regulator